MEVYNLKHSAENEKQICKTVFQKKTEMGLIYYFYIFEVFFTVHAILDS